MRDAISKKKKKNQKTDWTGNGAKKWTAGLRYTMYTNSPHNRCIDSYKASAERISD